jgi:hypothetical protein
MLFGWKSKKKQQEPKQEPEKDIMQEHVFVKHYHGCMPYTEKVTVQELSDYFKSSKRAAYHKMRQDWRFAVNQASEKGFRLRVEKENDRLMSVIDDTLREYAVNNPNDEVSRMYIETIAKEWRMKQTPRGEKG